MKKLKSIFTPFLALGLSLGPIVCAYADTPSVANKPPQAKAVTSTAAPQKKAPNVVDYIVAVVNQDPIAYTQLKQATEALTKQMASQGAEMPSAQKIRQAAFDNLVNEQLQLQLAKKIGLSITEDRLQTAILNIAQQNGISVDRLYEQAQADGIDKKQVEDRIRKQLLLSLVREREVTSNIKTSATEVANFITKQDRDYQEANPSLLNLALIQINIPTNADTATQAQIKAKAQAAYSAITSGKSFSSVAQLYSDISSKAIGFQPASNFPKEITQALKSMPIGSVSPLIQTATAFYIAQLDGKKDAPVNGWAPEVELVHVRHILLHTTPTLSRKQAFDELEKWRSQILKGKANFETLAKKYSNDPSAKTNDGDLGWVQPSIFVPEFTQALAQLQPGQISEPVLTRFGVHLIELMGEKKEHLSGSDLTSWASHYLQNEKIEKAYKNWIEQLRQNAYIHAFPAPSSSDNQ